MNKKKGFILYTVLLVCIVACSVNIFAKNNEKPSIKFNESSYNFGMISEKGVPVSHEFTFTNDGNGNLVIIEAKAECGCTKPEFPENPIAPGKKGKIKVTYNPLGRPGAFTKIVTVKTNGSPSKVRLKIQGTVKP